jgi:putative addiction module killer protein
MDVVLDHEVDRLVMPMSATEPWPIASRSDLASECHIWHTVRVWLLRLPAFLDWLTGLSPKNRTHVDARLLRIQESDHFGDARYLAELRWKSGTRVYFSKIEDPQGKAVLLILGGTKHGQDKDISKARALLRRHTVEAP